MKKNRTMRVAALLLALTLITSCFVGGTMAKYTNDSTVEDSTRVALWEFTVNNKNIATETVSFQLFDTVYDTNDDAAEDKITTNNGTLIAPGTKGEFTIDLVNNSEVDATYAIDYDVKKNGIPIQFKVGTGSWGDLADVSATAIAKNGGTATVKVEWQWIFDGNDTTDTNLGKVGTAKVEISAKITATQVDK